jgi:hypothetical protein
MNQTTISLVQKLSVHTFAFGLVLLTTLFISSYTITHAATYAYVNNFGTLSYVEANSFNEAFTKVTNISSHSGIILMDRIFIPTYSTQYNYSSSGYLYVNELGFVTRVSADSSAEAFADSNNISDHSGVMSIDNLAESNMQGDSVKGI